MENNIREYAEEYPVEIRQLEPEYGEKYKSTLTPNVYESYKNKRWVVIAKNEGGYNCTEVDLLDLLNFVKKQMPELWNTASDFCGITDRGYAAKTESDNNE